MGGTGRDAQLLNTSYTLVQLTPQGPPEIAMGRGILGAFPGSVFVSLGVTMRR